VNPTTTTTFDLPSHLAAKADPALIGTDDHHFSAIAAALHQQVVELSERLDGLRKAPGGRGRAAADRDREIHRLSASLRILQRFGLDLCLGRIVSSEAVEPIYIGRIGLTDPAGRRLLVDWRAPASEPFFAATHAQPMGLRSRRRYRWRSGRIVDYWDEVFVPEALPEHAALDDQSAFIASLGSSRSARMQDVLSTIQADQDAAIRASSNGALVVDGGPGTGKTVVALHRAAYLLYADPHVNRRRGGVLFVGPHRPYLSWVADVLPSLGEEGVQTCTLRDLVVEGPTARVEADPEVARLKSSAAMVDAIEPAVALYEEPPSAGLAVETPWADVWLGPADWIEAFNAPDPGTPHNEARDEIWDALASIVSDKLSAELDELVSPAQVRGSLVHDDELSGMLDHAWTLIEPADLVGDLWSVPAYLRRCAPWLSPDQIALLQRAEPQAWTVSDLPLLDAARLRLGDPRTARRRRRREAAVAAQREVMTEVIAHIVDAADDWGDDVIMLHGGDLQDALIDPDAVPAAEPDLLAGPFAHVIVDEAQELTDAEWQMLVRRCPSRSFTIVGDRAQARHGFTETWQQRLHRVGFDSIRSASLRVNYRTPEEVMAEARPVIEAVVTDANVPTSIRRTGVPVLHGRISDRDTILEGWLAAHTEGTACVIGDPTFAATPRVLSLTPELAKGLEFDLVLLIEGDSPESGIEASVDRYVAMTRATQRLARLSVR
jgi:Viral (Superfamily 1) RNA helicase